MQATIPTVADDRVERVVRNEAARIVAVSEDKDNLSGYQFFLSEFPRKDILGMSVGNRRIYINYKLASLALRGSGYRWLLRQTLAHEIAHETAGHAEQKGVTSLNRGMFGGGRSGRDVGLPWSVRFYNYSTEKELEADLRGLGYWNKLDWDCRIWVHILENFQKQDYPGDIFHPTDRRLLQARRVCPAEDEERQLGLELPGTESDRQPARLVN
jgi:predicted Zn-dependent protease